MKMFIEGDSQQIRALILSLEIFLTMVDITSLKITTESSVDYIGDRYMPGAWAILSIFAQKGKGKKNGVKVTIEEEVEDGGEKKV